MRVLALVCLLVGLVSPAYAQDSGEGRLPGFVEQQLSGEGRIVRLRGVSGLLTAKATIAEITVADTTGVWLRLLNAEIDWTRADLFSGVLTINNLSAETVEMLRRPVSAGDVPVPEAAPWAIPELPVAVNIGALRIGQLVFSPDVFGQAARLRSVGSLNLAGGNLAAFLEIVRLDGAGGTAELRASYQITTDVFDVELAINEPEQGVIANALNLAGLPSVGLIVAGHGPVAELDIAYSLDTDGQRRVAGQAFVRRREAGLAFTADFSAELADLVAAKYRPLFASVATARLAGGKTANLWQIEALEVSAAGLKLNVSGTEQAGIFAGDIGIETEDLGKFSGILGSEVSGAGSVGLSGTISPLEGKFDLGLHGTVIDLAPGKQIFARLLRGETTLSGRLMRDDAGLHADQIALVSDQVAVILDGDFGSSNSDLVASLDLKDLSDLGVPLRAAARVVAHLTGADGRFDLAGTAKVPSAAIGGQTVKDVMLEAKGVLRNSLFLGELAGSALVAGLPAHLQAGVAGAADGAVLRNMKGGFAGVDFLGNARVDLTGLVVGQFSARAGNLAPLAEVFGLPIDGSVDRADIALTNAGGRQDVAAVFASRLLTSGKISARGVEASIEAVDAFGTGRVQISVLADQAGVGSVDFTDVSAELDNSAGPLAFLVAANNDVGAALRLAGRFDAAKAISIAAAGLALAGQDVVLLAPTLVRFSEGGVSVAPTTLRSGSGEMFLSGVFGKEPGGEIAFADFPLQAAALVTDRQTFAGSLSGTIDVNGTADAPELAFDLIASDFALPLAQRLGMPTLEMRMSGKLRASVLTFDAISAKGDGIAANASGAVPLAGGGVDLGIRLEKADLASLDDRATGQAFFGVITGTGRITGDLADLKATYALSGQDLSAPALREAGIASFTAQAGGSFSDHSFILGPTTISGAGGLGLSASGSLSLAGGPLAVSLVGAVPLALANGLLAGRGAQVQGTANVSAHITGTVAAAQILGSLAVENATFADTASNLRLESIGLVGEFTGQSVAITSASARSSAGGTMEVSGRLDFGNGRLNPDIVIRLQNLAYADGRTVVTRLSGDLALQGPLAGGAVLSGTIALGETQVVIPEVPAKGGGGLPDIEHRGQTPQVQQTLDRVAAAAPGRDADIGSTIRVDVGVTSPGRIFVRGRGLDTELRGSLQITGNLGDVIPVGAFEMVRGRFSILGQRFDFREGQVTLAGNFDPMLNFRAETRSGEATVVVSVSGSASDPLVVFSSVPPLPQDEVIALLIFNRGLGDLSPFQLLQLASAVRTLNGGGDDGLFSRIRNAAGLDDLDIQTEDDGSATVRAGKYIEDNIYLDLEAGSKGTTRATINLDLSDDISAKATAGSDGDTGIGIFFERDY